MTRASGYLRAAAGRWLCRRHRHDLKPITAPGCLNVGVCRRCGEVFVMRRGEAAQWIGPSL